MHASGVSNSANLPADPSHTKDGGGLAWSARPVILKPALRPSRPVPARVSHFRPVQWHLTPVLLPGRRRAISLSLHSAQVVVSRLRSRPSRFPCIAFRTLDCLFHKWADGAKRDAYHLLRFLTRVCFLSFDSNRVRVPSALLCPGPALTSVTCDGMIPRKMRMTSIWHSDIPSPLFGCQFPDCRFPYQQDAGERPPSVVGASSHNDRRPSGVTTSSSRRRVP